MITPAYCQMMARYNAWQNSQLHAPLEKLGETALREDRGAFFGSIFATLNHLLWGDTAWMFRFGAGPEPVHDRHTELTASLEDWRHARTNMDREISAWARDMTQDRLDGDLAWTSKLTGKTSVDPMGQLVTHFFNHQTHHRGQVHAMLTAAGQTAPVSDLGFMPKEEKWP